MNLIINKPKPKYVPGYCIQKPEELMKFRNHRWYVKTRHGFKILPHVWAENLLMSDAVNMIRNKQIYVAIKVENT